MKVTILAMGTRGDVQPMIALGKGLQARGHHVSLFAAADFTAWIQSHGLTVKPSEVNMRALMSEGHALDWVENGHRPIRQFKIMQRLLTEHAPRATREVYAAAQGADLLVSSFTTDVYADSVAEKLGIRRISALLQPALVPTRDGRVIMNAPQPNRSSLLNYLFQKYLIVPAPWQWIGKANNYFRKESLGLPPLRKKALLERLARVPILLGYSPQVVPHPADWPDNIRTTGYWFLDEETAWQPPPALEAFLNAGGKPLCLGFGSMPERHPQTLVDLLAKALRLNNQRAVFLSGWSTRSDLRFPPEMFPIDFVPHGWLFPRIAASIHHGGAGTTSAGFRFGVPQLVLPYMGDQLFWGQRVASLGVGPKPIHRFRATENDLAEAFRTVATQDSFREAAQRIQREIQREDGVATAMQAPACF